MSNKNVSLTFLGTGTSQGVPIIGCDCEVCISNNHKDNRLRASVIFQSNGKLLLIDSGPDLRQQILRAKIDNFDAVIYTHEHKDHTAGLDDIRPIVFKHKKDMPIYCEERVLNSLKREFHYIFDDDFKYPGIPNVISTIIDETDFIVEGVKVTPIRGYHFKLPVLGFRVGNIAYITDMNRIDDNEINNKLKNLDYLVINALHKEKHISHFNLNQSIEMANLIGAKKTYFTHMSHNMGLHDIVNKELPANIELAYDGLVIISE